MTEFDPLTFFIYPAAVLTTSTLPEMLVIHWVPLPVSMILPSLKSSTVADLYTLVYSNVFLLQFILTLNYPYQVFGAQWCNRLEDPPLKSEHALCAPVLM